MDQLEPVLLVTLMDPAAPAGGRESLYRLNANCLENIFGDHLIVHQLKKRSPRIIASLRGQFDGIDIDALNTILATINENKVRQVFIDGSNLGAIAAWLRHKKPGLRIVTFFHNIEARFFLGSVRARKSLKSVAVLVANYLAERRSMRASDAIVTLSERDSAGLFRLYGRGADYITPMALIDRASDKSATPAASRERTLLFVGGFFYANRLGIEWFAREVAPHLSCRTEVVGRGMEALRAELAGIENVHIVGEVDDLETEYQRAYCVIAPIFDGSGMKTKVAEALMYGKHIIGTREALAGYDQKVRAVCWQADDAPSFVQAIEAAFDADLPMFDPQARELYEAEYSFEAAQMRMAEIMQVAPIPTRPEFAKL